MPLNRDVHPRVHRRLLPLYVAAFFEGVILWYAIERLFMTSIGFTYATVGVMIAAYSAMMLLAETPSGVLADRWSRKGVLLVGFTFLALSSFLGGISNSTVFYIGVTLCWAIYKAMTSGTYDSVIYDTVLEETGSAEHFARYYARYTAVDSVALVLGALLGGVAAAVLPLRGVYFVSVPLAVFGIVAIVLFREPLLHKAAVADPVRKHVAATLRGLRAGGNSTAILGVLLVSKALLYLSLFGFAQLWLVSLGAPPVLYGVAYAAICATGLTGALLMRLAVQRVPVMAGVFVGMALSCIGLAVLRDPVAVVACQVLLGTGLVSVGIVFTQYLHDYLDSSIRAGASSALSTLTRCLIIPSSLAIGYVSERYTIFDAGWILLALVLVLGAIVLPTLAARTGEPLSPATAA